MKNRINSYRSGFKEATKLWQRKYKWLEKEKAEAEKIHENYKSNHRKKIDDLNEALKLSGDLLSEIAGIKLFLITALEKSMQQHGSLIDAIQGNISKLEIKHEKIKKLQ